MKTATILKGLKLSIIFSLIFNSVIYCQYEKKVEIYLAKSLGGSNKHEIDVKTVVLDSILLSSYDLLAYNDSTFEFTLRKKASTRLKEMNLDSKVFCIVVDGEKILAGIFWPCYSSLGMTGFVSYNLNCREKDNKLRIGYCLGPGPEEYPGIDPRKKITIANKK